MKNKVINLTRRQHKFLCLERVTIAEWQGASEEQKFVAKLTQSNMTLFFTNGIISRCKFFIVDEKFFLVPNSADKELSPKDFKIRITRRSQPMEISKILNLSKVVFISLLCTNSGISNPTITPAVFKPFPPSDWESISYALLNQASLGNTGVVLQQFENIAAMLEKSDDALTDSCEFLQAFINTINESFGTNASLSEVLQFTRESLSQLSIPNDDLEMYYSGLNLIDSHVAGYVCGEQFGSFSLVKHHHKKSNVWSWLSVATVTVGAVTICVLFPGSITPLLNGIVELGKIFLENQK